MDFIIGVDGGGTKTDAAAYDMSDNKITESSCGPGNPAVDFSLAETNIKQAVSQCISSMKSQGIIGKCQGIYMGIAGIEVRDNQSQLEQRISEEFNCKAIGVHDSELVHAAIFKGQDGIITIAGTGSVSYGRRNGRTQRTGGWGHVLGDEGSGYWIGLEALKRMTLEQDMGMKVSELAHHMMLKLGVQDIGGMKDFVHATGKIEIAATASAVVELARTGNSDALKILDRAGQELAIMTERLYKKLEVSEPVSIGLSGGILVHVDQVRDAFRTYLEANLDSIRILEEFVSPTSGACHLHEASIT